MNDICCPLNETARISVNQPGTAGPDGVLLYSEMEQCVCATVQLLGRNGWSEGERVVFALPFDWKELVMLLAVIRHGVVVCPVDPARDEGQLRQIIRFLGVTRVVTTASQAEAFSCQDVTVECIDQYVGYIDKMKARHKPHIPLNRTASILIQQDKDSVVMYAYPYSAHYYSALGGNRVIRITAKDRWFSAVPVYQSGGLDAVFRCIISGAVLVLPAPEESILEAIKKYEVTHLTLTPDQLDDLLKDDAAIAVLRDLVEIVVMGRTTFADTLASALRHKLNVCGAYISPVVPGILTYSGSHVPVAARHTSGLPHAYAKVRLTDAGAIECAGHILAEGCITDGVMVPFEQTGEWVSTGDSGSYDQHGCLTVD